MTLVTSGLFRTSAIKTLKVVYRTPPVCRMTFKRHYILQISSSLNCTKYAKFNEIRHCLLFYLNKKLTMMDGHIFSLFVIKLFPVIKTHSIFQSNIHNSNCSRAYRRTVSNKSFIDSMLSSLIFI